MIGLFVIELCTIIYYGLSDKKEKENKNNKVYHFMSK